MAIDDVADRAHSYGFDGVAINGNDVLAVYQSTLGHWLALEAEKVRRSSSARPTDGTAIQSTTRRSTGRTKSWQCGRVEIRFRRLPPTCKRATCSPTTRCAKSKARVAQTIDEAVECATNAPDPQPEDAVTDLYA